MKLFEEPAERQPSYHELRTEFRAKALAYIRSCYSQRHPRGWNMIREELERRGFTAEGWAQEMLRRLDAPVVQDFGLNAAPPTLGWKLSDQAEAAAKHDSATWDPSVEGTADPDAGPCNLAAMTDDEICDYVASQIEESKKDG